MPVPMSLRWKKFLEKFFRWEYNTHQLLAFIMPVPLFLIVGAFLSYYFPVMSFVVALLYLFIILPAVIMAIPSPSSLRVPKALLHSFILCWAVAGILPLDSYMSAVMA